MLKRNMLKRKRNWSRATKKRKHSGDTSVFNTVLKKKKSEGEEEKSEGEEEKSEEEEEIPRK